MANTSATGGYLAPGGTPLPADIALEDILQPMVAGITGLAGQYVRPRWQPGNPRQPEPDTDWCAIGVTATRRDDGPAIIHDGTGDGSDAYIRHEDIDVLATFYGPNCQRNAATLQDGLQIPQNLEALFIQGFSFVEARDARRAPEFFNQQWINRFDVTIRFRRRIDRTYAVLNILSADPAIHSN